MVVGWAGEAVGSKGGEVFFFFFFFEDFEIFIWKRRSCYSPDSCWTPGWSCVLNNWL